jgi:hypothetical protein
MSDLMLFGVLRMPFDMAMSGEIAQRQFYDRAQEALDRMTAAEAELDTVRRELEQERAETARWKSAHADMAKRNAILRDRPDLPVDRTMAHDALVQAQAKLNRRENMDETNERAHRLVASLSADMESIADLVKGPPAPDSSHSWHDLVPKVRRLVRKYRILLLRNRHLRHELEAQSVATSLVEDELAKCHDIAQARSKDVTRLTMKASMLESRAERSESETLAMIGELAAIKFSLLAPPADMQTERKAQDIMIRTGMAKAGYILQAKSGGGAALVHLGAVRWLSDGELWEAVHPGEAAPD